MNVKTYQVGGWVRDRLMGMKPKDLDYAVVAKDFSTMLLWIQERGTVFMTNEEFLTVRARLPGKPPADFVLCRRDGDYGDGRRPDMVFAGTLEDDLRRRDFTVNAIAFDEESGEYMDPHGGRADIASKILRCVGDTRDRFSEDALRMLRAIRFAITKGFSLHQDIEDVLVGSRELADRLARNVSKERQREELYKCFAHDTCATLEWLARFPLVREACFRGGPLWLMPTNKHT